MNTIPAKHNPFASANFVDSVGFTIGAEGSNIINVGLQLKDSRGANIKAPGALQAYLSDNADGSTVTATAPTTVAIGTNGLAIESVSDKLMTLVSESNGTIDIDLTYAGGAATWYLVVILPDGSISVSSAITFA